MINVLINGSNGKMGTALKRYIEKTSDVCIKYEIDKDSSISFKSLNQISDKPDVIIDFSSPEATFLALDYAVCNLVPMVIATTGFDESQSIKILEYSEAIPIFKSSNMSYIIHLISKILKNISPQLAHMDIEIIEKHHNRKKDSPSGTALFLADTINSINENKYTYVYSRNSISRPRDKNEIGFSSIRGGNIVGEHTISFLGDSESFEITHIAHDREIFAEGAIRAARFIINQKNGLYGMDDLVH